MARTEYPEVTCRVCGHQWKPRKPHPVACPGYSNGKFCNARDWDKEPTPNV